MCGEQPNYPLAPNPVKGSPPRVRGTDVFIILNRPLPRITPACAGNSPLAVARAAFAKDHPRVCGEQVTQNAILLRDTGSPPRVRGTVLSCPMGSSPLGITPACAGNSSIQAARKGFLQDHPRVCGEQTYSVVLSRIAPGSPPRVRGTEAADAGLGTGKRITPACAGNSI